MSARGSGPAAAVRISMTPVRCDLIAAGAAALLIAATAAVSVPACGAVLLATVALSAAGARRSAITAAIVLCALALAGLRIDALNRSPPPPHAGGQHRPWRAHAAPGGRIRSDAPPSATGRTSGRAVGVDGTPATGQSR